MAASDCLRTEACHKEVGFLLFVTADNYNNATYPITLVSIAEIQMFGY
ncbi:MAG: hypothetical protein OHK0022_10660 [Roseiflexaceae bacterium]